MVRMLPNDIGENRGRRMTISASHDSMELVGEAESQASDRSTFLQPYVPGRRASVSWRSRGSRQNGYGARLPTRPLSVADLCERVANAADATEAAALLATALADVLAVDAVVVSLDARKLKLDSRPAAIVTWTGGSGSGTGIARPHWPLSSASERQVHTAQALVMAGGECCGWVRVERMAQHLEGDEVGCLRIVASALGQRLATLQVLDARLYGFTREDRADAPNRGGR